MTKTLNKYYNPNPLKRDTTDCVVRALVKATGKDWDVVFKELFDIGFELKVMPNSDVAWKEYLTGAGFTYVPIKVKKGSKRPTVQSFTKENKKGVYVLRVANHLVTSDNGYYYDTFDSGNCSMYGYWEKPKEEEIV